MTPQRAAEILASYGANPARWPTWERGACAALIAADPALQAEQARAAVLDDALAAWARAPVATGRDDAIGRALARAGASAGRAWGYVGGAVAASVAAALYWSSAHPPVRNPQPAIAYDQARADSALFQTVFTPTPDEEDVL